MKKIPKIIFGIVAMFAFVAATPPIRYSIYTTGTVAQVDEHVSSVSTNVATNGVLSFNTRSGAVTLASNDVVTALGFVPGSGGGTGEVTLSQLEGSTNTATLAAQGMMTTNTTTQFWLYSPPNGPGGLTFYGDGEDVVFHIPHSGGSHVSASGYIGSGAELTNLNASALASGTVPLAALSGIRSNQFDTDTWTLATNQSGGSGTPIRAGTNVVIYADNGTNVINAVRYSTLTNVALRDATVPLSLVATNRDSSTNHFMLWFAPDGTNSMYSTLRWTQTLPVSATGEITFWPAHSSGYPELIFAVSGGSLCYYYDFIQWGQPSHVGPAYEYWKSATYSGDYSTGTLDTNLSVSATWCFQAYCWTNTGYTNVCFAGSRGQTSGNTPMPTLQFRATSTNGSGAWIFMDNFDPSAISSTTIGTKTYKYYADTMNATERLRITAGPDGGLSFNGSLKVNGAYGYTTNYPMPNGDIMSVSNGIITYIGPVPAYGWTEIATNYLARIGTELTNSTLATNVNEFVKDCQASGVLTNFDGLYLLCGEAATNTVNLLSANYTLTVVGEFATNDASGVDNGGVTTNYFRTGWTNSNTNGGTLFAYYKSDPSSGGSGLMNLMGARSPNFIAVVRATTTWSGGINNGQYTGYMQPASGTNTGPGSICVTRRGETDSAMYRDGSLTAISTSTNAPAGLQLGSLWLFDCNGSATQKGQWRGKAQVFAFGTNGISPAQYQSLHSAVTNFNARMGR